MRRIAYDGRFRPPAPVLPVRIVSPGDADRAALLTLLVDTGADCSLIPSALAESVGLPLIGSLEISGIGGASSMAPLYAAWVEVAGTRLLSRVVAFGDEAILGRDVLRGLVLRIDGPGGALTVERPKRRAGRAARS